MSAQAPYAPDGVVPSCKGANPHVFALGAGRCSICGWDRYATFLLLGVPTPPEATIATTPSDPQQMGESVQFMGQTLAWIDARRLGSLLMQRAADARQWQVTARQNERALKSRAALRARLEGLGATHIHFPPGGDCLWRSAAGTPMILPVTGAPERPACSVRELGPGPQLEYRVQGGRKWYPQSEPPPGFAFIKHWRLAVDDP